jgi:nucleolar protein 58
MLVLFETSAGFALFKVLDEAKVKECEDLHKDFSSLEKANAMVQLNAFRRFKDTTDALSATTALVESKLSKGLSRFLKKSIVKEVCCCVCVSSVFALCGTRALPLWWDCCSCERFCAG